MSSMRNLSTRRDFMKTLPAAAALATSSRLLAQAASPTSTESPVASGGQPLDGWHFATLLEAASAMRSQPEPA